MKYAALLLLSVTALLAVVGCDPAVPINQRYGQLLAPSAVQGCPKGCIPYVTAPGDRLYLIADQAYGQGYKLHRIASLPENKNTLAAALKPDGTLEKGKILFLPPDETGKSVVPEKRWYFGGTSKR